MTPEMLRDEFRELYGFNYARNGYITTEYMEWLESRLCRTCDNCKFGKNKITEMALDEERCDNTIRHFIFKNGYLQSQPIRKLNFCSEWEKEEV